MKERTPARQPPMGDQAWRMLRLNNRMPLDEAARRVSALHFATEALSAEERNLLDIAEGLLELVHVGAAVNTCTPRPSGPTPTRECSGSVRHSWPREPA